MQIHLLKKSDFQICGCYVETSLSEHNKDVSALYERYFNNGIAEQISSATDDYGTEYYSVTWYTQLHERYRYLFGKKVNTPTILSTEFDLKSVPATSYAIASFPQGQDVYQAWTDFLNTMLPNAGYTPDIDGNFIEYFPDGIHGRYEIWAPLVNTDV